MSSSLSDSNPPIIEFSSFYPPFFIDFPDFFISLANAPILFIAPEIVAPAISSPFLLSSNSSSWSKSHDPIEGNGLICKEGMFGIITPNFRCSSNIRTALSKTNLNFCGAARTMLIFSKAPLFLWADAVATACYTQNRSLIRKRHNKTPCELLHNRKPDLSYLHVFGALFYPTNDSEDLDKLKPKADIGIFVGYAPAKKAYRIYNKRTCLIIETIHIDFDELTTIASEQFSSGPGP
ncbi:retrovirus-related pol polyprotein from transposon TNT 1-94 [Tanacetum coccineum]